MAILLKQIVGIDVSQKELVVTLGRMKDDLNPELFANKCFINTAKGFKELEQWVKKFTDGSVSIRYVMEATGVYHESLAYYLTDKGYDVSIVLPNKISSYMRTLDLKTITDKTSAESIARFGLERKLENWKRPKPTYKTLKQLNREQQQIVEERTMVKNHLHAELAQADCCPESVDRIKKRIAFLNKQEKQVKEQIAKLISNDKEVEADVKLLCSIPGVGVLTASTILAETNGFDLIRNKKQLTSYAGLDIREKQSGTSVNGKPRISKKGNKRLRKAMHMPALSAIRYDDRFKSIFERIVAKHGIKMKAIVAIQRKLLEMTYTIFKTKKPYQSNYTEPIECLQEAELTKN